jgi:hypothetical protein
MARLALTARPYINQSVIANAQRAVNVYGEINDKGAPVPITWYPTPGTELFSETEPTVLGKNRGIYRTTLGTCYTVIQNYVYQVLANGALVFINTIPDRAQQVSFADNGIVMVFVDGVEGFCIELATNTFGQISDPAFYGADFVVFLDTFFVFNNPDTNQFYWSLGMVDFAMLTGGTAFDPLDIAAKSGKADYIVSITAVHRELWLIGEISTEVWIGTGAADSYFQQQQGAFFDHGSIAAFSLAIQDISLFFLMQDGQGKCMVVQAGGYQIKAISPPAIVKEFSSYTTVSDAIGFCFQLNGHIFYAIIFPTENKSWLYDMSSDLWCEWAFLNTEDGSLNRVRANSCTFAHGKILMGDFEHGKINRVSDDIYTDQNNEDEDIPIVRIRTFPHLINDSGSRIIYNSFQADMECGQGTPGTDYYINLSWSDDKGISFGDPVQQVFGQGGEYLTSPTWLNLGMARDRVFKLQWSAAVKTALNGAFIRMKECRT